MQQQDALEFLAFQLKLPGKQARGDDWKFGSLREKIKRHAGDKQRDWKMDQHDVLRVFRKQSSFEVKRVQVRASIGDDHFAGHFGVDGAEVGIFSRLGEGVGKLLVGVEHLGLEDFFGTD